MFKQDYIICPIKGMYFQEEMSEEKGLFTFYKQQAEQEQIIKQQYQRNNNKSQLLSIQQQGSNMQLWLRSYKKQAEKLKIIKLNKKSYLYESVDHSVVVIKSSEKKNEHQLQNKQPLQRKLYDLKMRQLPSLQIFVHKSNFPFKNNQSPREKSLEYNKISLKDYQNDTKKFVQCSTTPRPYQSKLIGDKQTNKPNDRYQEVLYAANISAAIRKTSIVQEKFPVIQNKIRSDHRNSQLRNLSTLSNYSKADGIQYKSRLKMEPKLLQNFKRDVYNRKIITKDKKQKQQEMKKFNLEKNRLIAIIKKMNIGHL